MKIIRGRLGELYNFGFKKNTIKNTNDFCYTRVYRTDKRRILVHVFTDGSMAFYDLRKYKFVNESCLYKKQAMFRKLYEAGILEESK